MRKSAVCNVPAQSNEEEKLRRNRLKHTRLPIEAHSIAYFPGFHGPTDPFERLTGSSTVRKRTL